MRTAGKIYNFGLIITAIVLLFSCGSTNTRTISNYDELREAIHNKTFEIEHIWALPMAGGMIDLIGNPNYIRIKNDSVDLFLPYFGERFGGGGFNNVEGGIEYKGPAKDFKVTERQKRQLEVRFDGKQNQDPLRFVITVYPDGSATTNVQMTQRQTISYRGNVKRLPEE